MRLGKIVFAVTLSTALSAAAMDNGVMVDLSVLNNLSDSYESAEQPLFPIVSETKSTRAHPVKAIEKKAAPVKSEVAKSSSSRHKKKKSVENQMSKERLKKTEEPLIKTVDVEPVNEEPIVVVDVEPVAPAVVENNIEQPAPVLSAPEEQKVTPPSLEENKKENIEIPLRPDIIRKNEDSTEIVKEEKTPQEDKDVSKNSEFAVPDENKSVEPVDVSQNPEEKLLPEEAINPLFQEKALSEPQDDTKDNQLRFSEGQDELNSLQMSKLDNLAGHFKNEPGSKILIFAYNVSNVEDSFRKKRISLNRAIEIRSYLIKQGFKNFSIKIVNVGLDSDKVNTVELEEI